MTGENHAQTVAGAGGLPAVAAEDVVGLYRDFAEAYRFVGRHQEGAEP